MTFKSAKDIAISRLTEKAFSGAGMIIVALLSGSGSGGMVHYMSQAETKLWVAQYVEAHVPPEAVKVRLSQCDEKALKMEGKIVRLEQLMSDLHTSLAVVKSDIMYIKNNVRDIAIKRN